LQEIGIAGWAFNQSILRQKTMTLLDLPRVSRELGVGTIELVSTFFDNQGARYLNEVRQAIQDQGLAVRNIAVDTGTLAAADPKERATNLAAIKQWFWVARAVGSAAIRVNTGAADPSDQEAVARCIEGYRDLAGEAAHTGVYLLIENHGGVSADPRNIRTFLDEVNSPWFLACPDTSNFTNDTWELGMEIMAPRAFSCHVKASGYDPSGKQSWTDRNGRHRSYDLRRSLRILKDANYQGPLMVEYGASPDERQGTADTIRYVKELVAGLG
jgi:sugar phosphate isomerase/epimerase